MSTKVKGEAIKEGSIPLSALAEDVKGEFDGKYGFDNYIGKLSDVNPKIETNYGRVIIYIKYKNLIYNSSDVNEIILNSGPKVVIKLTKLGYKTIIEIVEGTSNVGYYGPIYLYEDYNKPPTVTPDWNAQEGDAGYIENKPFSAEHLEITSTDYYYNSNIDKVVHFSSEGSQKFPLDGTIVITYIETELVAPFEVPNEIGSYDVTNQNDSTYSIVITSYEDARYIEIHGGPEDNILVKYDKIVKLDDYYINRPDWNAQEGESGYIENKPFYTDINTPLGQYNGGAMDNDTIEINVGTVDVFIIRTPYSFIKINDGDTEDFSNSPLPTTIPNVKITKIRYQYGYIFITVDNIDYNTQLIDWINNEWCGGEFTRNTVKIPQYFIPDTVIKTTPQTLTDSNKNQALTNLGIDPVVWKYMMNPYCATENTPIPDEVHNLIITDSEYGLKPIITNILLIDEFKVVSATSAADVVQTANDINYMYNRELKTFTIM